MSVTELQQRLIDAQGQFAAAQMSLAASTANLTPDQEAAVAAYLGEFEALLTRVGDLVSKVLHEPG